MRQIKPKISPTNPENLFLLNLIITSANVQNQKPDLSRWNSLCQVPEDCDWTRTGKIIKYFLWRYLHRSGWDYACWSHHCSSLDKRQGPNLRLSGWPGMGAFLETYEICICDFHCLDGKYWRLRLLSHPNPDRHPVIFSKISIKLKWNLPKKTCFNISICQGWKNVRLWTSSWYSEINSEA